MLGDMMARHLDRSSFYITRYVNIPAKAEYETKVSIQVDKATKEAMRGGGRFNWINLDRSI